MTNESILLFLILIGIPTVILLWAIVIALVVEAWNQWRRR